ncbi:MAG: hypothetical protein ACI9VR_000633 [Cognaticolwellia sp.]|jgi:hypothetical protein
MARALLASLPLFLLLGCDKDSTPETGDTTGELVCIDDNEGCPDVGSCEGDGENMLPGSNCLACHTQGLMPEHDEPDKWFGIGGTIFTDGTGEQGLEGAIIRVTDANGDVTELTSESSGNFYSRAKPVPPLRAEVEVDGVVRQMGTQVDTAACSSCHQCGGSAGGKLVP